MKKSLLTARQCLGGLSPQGYTPRRLNFCRLKTWGKLGEIVIGQPQEQTDDQPPKGKFFYSPSSAGETASPTRPPLPRQQIPFGVLWLAVFLISLIGGFLFLLWWGTLSRPIF